MEVSSQRDSEQVMSALMQYLSSNLLSMKTLLSRGEPVKECDLPRFLGMEDAMGVLTVWQLVLNQWLPLIE